MATHRPPHDAVRPNNPRKSRINALRAAVVAVGAAVLLIGMAPGSAAADPQPDISAVKKKVDALGIKVDKVTEDYNQARLKLDKAKKRVSHLNKRVKTQRKHVRELRKSVAAVATSAYMTGGSRLASLLTTEDPQALVDKAATLQQLSDQDDQRIDKYTRAAKALSSKQDAASKAVKEKKSLKKKLSDKKSSIEASLDKQQDLLSELRAEASTVQASRSSRSGERTETPANLPPASGRAAQAIAFAKAQLGKPYAWGAAGPSAYDCSGLTMAAYNAAGVSLPHSSQAQQSSGPYVPKSQLQPGDLVFFGSPVHHVGLYVGGGKMIHAPNSGEVVQYTSLSESYWSSTYAGAVRPS